MSHMPGGQKTSCRNWVSLPTMWALGIKLMGSGLVAGVFAPMSAAPAVSLWSQLHTPWWSGSEIPLESQWLTATIVCVVNSCFLGQESRSIVAGCRHRVSHEVSVSFPLL